MDALITVALLLALSPARANGFKMMSFGDGGGYKHPDPATQQFLDGPQPPVSGTASGAASSVAAGAPAAKTSPKPVVASAGGSAVSTRPPRPAASSLEVPRAGGLRPLAVAPGTLSSADAESASAGAESDYDARVLGLASGPRRAPLGVAAGAGASVPGAAVSAGGPRLFVSVAIDPREAGDLRDAVAALGAGAGFALDARFAPVPGPDGLARVSGWIPAARLADVLRGRGIRSVSVASPRPPAAAPLNANYRVGLFVSDPARASEEVRAKLEDLAREDGFRPTRVVGLQDGAAGRSIAFVDGSLPISRLGDVLARSGVDSVVPQLPAPATEARSARTAPRRGIAGFARYAFRRGLWLVLLTLLAALPAIRGAAARLAEVFNPYRR